MAQTGFFTKQTVVTDPKAAGVTPRRTTKKPRAVRAMDCSGCGLDRRCKSPRMAATGDGLKKILLIAESPGAEEDSRGIQLVGEAGQTQRKALAQFGIDLDRDCWKTNAIRCRPFIVDEKGAEKNRAPEPFEIDCCRSRVFADIAAFQPKLIILLGAHAVESVIGHRWKHGDLGGIGKWRGWTIPDRDINAWVCPTFHPSYINRSRNFEPVAEMIWEQDLERALACLDKPLPMYRDERSFIQVLPARLCNDKTLLGQVGLTTAEEDEIIKTIDSYQFEWSSFHETHPPLFYLDFETNAKKPYLSGRRILSCAISIAEDKTISFPMTHRISVELAKVLGDFSIPKGAQNMKFEDAWANVTLPNCRVRGWEWDSMLGANILDNRRGVSGLKFQAYVEDGIIDYDSHLAEYKDADADEYEGDQGDAGKDANALNRIEQAPAGDVLMYGGMDALIGRRRSLAQMDKIEADADLLRAYNLFHMGTVTMAGMEQNGMAIDLSYVRTQYERIVEKRVPAMEAAIANSDVIKKWKERHGTKFNMGSDEQLGDVLVNVLGLTLPETKGSSEKKRRYSTAANVLELIEDDAPFVKEIADIERLKKVASTNLKGLMREAPDGMLHPFFNLGGDADGNHVVTSYRSSSSSPNFQNLPKRNKELERITRRAFKPRKGMQRLSVDFKGVEVGVAACVTLDSALIRYVSDKKTNMHRDMAQQLYILADDEWTKEARQSAKNHFVFPEFYGDWWMSTAEGLWRAIPKESIFTKAGKPMREHLADKGIEQFRCSRCARAEKNKKVAKRADHACCFENHVRLVEKDFWGRRFAEYTSWKERHLKQYEKRGYFYLVTGFMVGGVLRKNQVLNLPIQGPAFHINLWTLNRIWNRDTGIASHEDWKSLAVGQIHDSGEQDVWPDELDHIIKTYKHVVHNELPEVMPWVKTVPMDVEFSIAGVDRPWYESEEMKA